MSRYMWVVAFNQFYLGSDLKSSTTALVAARLFHSAEEADKYCRTDGGHIVKIIVYLDEVQ